MSRQVPQSRRFVALLLLVLMAGCQTWQPTTASPRTLAAEEAPPSMRITLTNGAIVTIKDPVVRGDSIMSAEEGLEEVVGVSAQDIGSLEVRRFSGRRTLAFIAAGIAIAAGWATAVTGSSGGSDGGPGPLPKDPG